MTHSRTWRCKHDPTLILLRNVRVFDECEAESSNIEIESLIVLAYDKGHLVNRLHDEGLLPTLSRCFSC